jgi:hypothetical protein
MYGRLSRHFSIFADEEKIPAGLNEWLQERKVMTSLIRQHLKRTAVRMKFQADKGRSECQFDVGDIVFLKLQPYIQSSLAPRANLAFKFFGPFPVIRWVGVVAYKLGLPTSSSVHPVFHVSQLKKVMGDQVRFSFAVWGIVSASAWSCITTEGD